jgi:hypothetical protein
MCNTIKNLLIILILTLSYQSSANSDVVEDLQIEGISIGDSALDYFSEAEIRSNKQDWYNDNKFYGVLIDVDSVNYDKLQIHFKSNDKKYIIHAIGGLKDFTNQNINDCYILKNKIDLMLVDFFENSKINHNGKIKHPSDKSEKSFVTQSYIDLNNGVVVTACYDLQLWDSDFRLIANTNEIDEWYGIAYE